MPRQRLLLRQVVGDERIELPQAESESAALPLDKSPSLLFPADRAVNVGYYSYFESVCQLFSQKKFCVFFAPCTLTNPFYENTLKSTFYPNAGTQHTRVPPNTEK